MKQFPLNFLQSMKVLVIVLSVSTLLNCKKDTPKVIPTVETSLVTNITNNSVLSGGHISDIGSDLVTARGVCWSIVADPTILDSKTNDGTGGGSFTSTITGLTSGNSYYLRAYATNSIGTAYGNQITTKTSAVLPTISSAAITNITTTGATGGGNITSDGGGAITSRGICWNTNQNPTINDNKTSDGVGSGSFTSTITGLTYGDPTVYVRAYATNNIGTKYGDQIGFTTSLSMTTYAGTGKGPLGIAFDGINIWTANSGGNSVTKIATDGAMATSPTTSDNSRPNDIAFDGKNMWSANFGNNSVAVISPTGVGTGAGTIYGSGVNSIIKPLRIAFDGINMWTVNQGQGNGNISKITTKGDVTTYFMPYSPIAIAFDGTNMWTAGANVLSNTFFISKVTPSGVPTTYTSTGFTPTDLAFDGANMWIIHQGGNVTKITSTGVMTTYTGSGTNRNGIAFDGINMWTANSGGNSVTKIAPDGAMTTYNGTGSYPYGIAFDGKNMWTTNFNDNSVTKILVK